MVWHRRDRILIINTPFVLFFTTLISLDYLLPNDNTPLFSTNTRTTKSLFTCLESGVGSIHVDTADTLSLVSMSDLDVSLITPSSAPRVLHDDVLLGINRSESRTPPVYIWNTKESAWIATDTGALVRACFRATPSLAGTSS